MLEDVGLSEYSGKCPPFSGQQVLKGYNQIVLQIDEFQRSGSGRVADDLQHLDLQSVTKIIETHFIFIKKSTKRH